MMSACSFYTFPTPGVHGAGKAAMGVWGTIPLGVRRAGVPGVPGVPAVGIYITRAYDQWIGLRENLQETMVFTIKYRAFL